MQETLVDICEPIFQALCRINRFARLSAKMDSNQVRSEIKAAFTESMTRAGMVSGLADPFMHVRPGLIAFADWVVRTSRLSWARTWKPLAEEEGLANPDAKFFALIDEAMREPGEAATQRLAVLYTCVGVGYTGIHAGAPETLRRIMQEMAGRIRPLMDADENARVTPDAYQNVDSSILTEPPTGHVTRAVVLLIGLSVVVLAAVWVGSRQQGAELREAVEGIVSPQSAGEAG